MNTLHKIAVRLLLALMPLASLQAQEQGVEVVVVAGIQPGPRLWKVTKDDHTLWILPLVSIVPKHMNWDDDRVAMIIADADAAITAPDISVGISKTLWLNPINLVRGMRLFNRLRNNPDGATLADVLPEALYRRYAALKTVYFPRDSSNETLRPTFAGEEVVRLVQDQQQLVSSEVIKNQITKLFHNNRKLKVTDIKLDKTLEGGYDELSKRVETMVSGLSREKEIACFDSQLTRLEKNLDDMKAVANAWAKGVVDDIHDYVRPDLADDPCAALLLQSSEGELTQHLFEESRQRWFDAALTALEHNHSTFTMLPMADITSSLSLVSKLAALGYEVHEPK